jgi:2-oxoglutarate ferredoxin oxidoreductase subunit gamma
MARTELRFAGFGGQGIILAGYIVGKAAAIYDKKNATLTQSYGPESRGGACSAGVVVSNTKVLYPNPVKPTVLTLMSQEACAKFEPQLPDDGVMLIDQDMVKPQRLNKTIKVYSIPATRIAENLGRKIVANIVMLGFFTGVTKIVTHDAMREAILTTVPPTTKEMNVNAFEQGYEEGVKAQPIP